MPDQMYRAQADAHRAQLLHIATTGNAAERGAAWQELKDFNAARRVQAQANADAGFARRYEAQQQGIGHVQAGITAALAA